jgi:putative ABC transport system ATP-binding protein
MVLVTHDPVLAGYADRRIVLRDGLVISDERNAERRTQAVATVEA